MKRILFILLSLFYLGVSSGIALSIHYCEGKVKYIDVIPGEEHQCCPEEDHSNSCCDDRVFFFKLDTEQITNQNTRNLGKHPDQGMDDGVFIFFHNEIADENRDYYNHKIPLLKIQPVWLMHCSLLFYG